ncbi:MAG TPA: hypothetical protein VFO83_10690 [Aggregicoccus sp.]|nr:hypothetical protein [Aggregicoccus sp.]
MQKSSTRLIALAALLGATLAGAAESRTFIFRSVEDASTPADPAVCASAPFAANVLLGGSLWWQQTSPRDGHTSARLTRRIGKATACVQLTNFTFPPGLDQNFYVAFDLPEGRFTATGSCKIISNRVPVAGLVLGGCSMSLTGWPQGYTGGAVVSLSTLNPFRLEGYNTGSTYVLQAYLAEDPGGEREQHLGHSMSYVELAELP